VSSSIKKPVSVYANILVSRDRKFICTAENEEEAAEMALCINMHDNMIAFIEGLLDKNHPSAGYLTGTKILTDARRVLDGKGVS